MDPACPTCGTEGCHYSRDGNEEGVEIWLCENGHTFNVTVPSWTDKDTWKKWFK